MKKNNKLYRILALFLVMTLALFLTPTAFAADDLDDLGPLIPSDYFADIDDLPPLIPKDPPSVPPGKDPPTEPPIEIQVPDDGEDLDLDLSEIDINKLLEGSAWTILINDSSSGSYVGEPGMLYTVKMSFVADKSGGGDMFGTYKARAAFISMVDFDNEESETQSVLFESESFTFELQPYVDDDDLGPLVPSSVDLDDPDYLPPLVPSMAQWIGSMPGTCSVLTDPYNYQPIDKWDASVSVKLIVLGNGRVKMSSPEFPLADDVNEFLGTLSRSIDGRELT